MVGGAFDIRCTECGIVGVGELQGCSFRNLQEKHTLEIPARIGRKRISRYVCERRR